MNERPATPLSDDGPVEGEILMPTGGDMAPAVAAEISQQVATARKYPRRRDKEISDEIMGRAVLNPEIAAECMYSLPRGNKTITGPSIRFAEIVRASFGNIRVAARFVRLDLDDRERGAVIVEAAAIDLQSNNAECIPVRRSVMTSAKGKERPRVFSADMINMTVNAAASLARRNAILAVVPKAIWIEGYQRVIKVLQGDAKTLGARRQEVLDGFARVGVAAERVFGALDVKSVEDITLEHMPQLMGYVSRIKDGEHPDAVFGRGDGQATHDTVKNPLQDRPGDTQAGGVSDDEGPAPSKTEAQRTADANEAGADVKTGELKTATETKTATPKAATTTPAKGPAAAAKAKAVEDLAAIETPAQYREYAMAWIDAATDPAAARAQWGAERTKRTELDLSEELLVEMSGAMQAKVRSLAPAP